MAEVKFEVDKITNTLVDNVKKAVNKSALIVQASAKSHCPTNEGELKNSITISFDEKPNQHTSIIGTNKEYGAYVEFGTGPIGEAHKSELPPEIANKLSYRGSGWFIHSSQIDEKTAEKYHFKKFYNDDGEVEFYFTNGAKPHPFLSTAYNECKDTVIDNVKQAINKSLK